MARIADIGLIPQTRTIDGRTQKGFRVFVGGGLGNKSYVAHQLEDFTPEENILYTSIAVVRLFDRLGNRKNLARNRLRYLVNQTGWDKFRNLILKERDLVRATQSVVVKMPVGPPIPEITGRVHISHRTGETPAGYARWLKSNTFAQKQDGYHTVFVGLEAGDITSTQLRALADIIQEYSSEGTGRIGFNQNIAMRYIHEDDLVPLYSRLLESGLAKSGALTMATPIGCSGTTSCNLALTNSHRLAKEIQREFLSRDLDNDDSLRTSSIKISGCPNSCGQHGIATIGFYGGGGRLGRDMYPSYMLSLGGRADGDAVLGQNVLRVPAKRVIPVILRIIEIFRERAQPRDDLRSWVHRVVMNGDDTTIQEIRSMLSPLTHPAHHGRGSRLLCRLWQRLQLPHQDRQGRVRRVEANRLRRGRGQIRHSRQEPQGGGRPDAGRVQGQPHTRRPEPAPPHPAQGRLAGDGGQAGRLAGHRPGYRGGHIRRHVRGPGLPGRPGPWEHMGHRAVSLLENTYSQWSSLGLETDDAVPDVSAAAYNPVMNDDILATHDDLESPQSRHNPLG